MISMILLAGGLGKRMGSSIPKQFLPIHNKPLALHSLEVFKTCKEITEIVVVVDPIYQHFFPNETLFALPGKRRQDSVYSGLLKTSKEIVLIHDAARPFVEKKYIDKLIEAILKTGAAALGEPVTNTIKQCTKNLLVEKTLDRSTLWQAQTPQGAKKELLLKAFLFSIENNIDVTDELSLMELISHPSEIIPCTSRNMKITTPFDLTLAHAL